MVTPGSLGLVTQEPPKKVDFGSWAISLPLVNNIKQDDLIGLRELGKNLSFSMSLQ
jgi:hypothetical protein